MRITGGTLSGRTFKAPEGMGTRPTTDRVRESLFDILCHRDWNGNNPFEGPALDGFCGTGALAFESLSHGAPQAFLFDKDRKALATARENARALGLESSCTFFPLDAQRPPEASVPCSLLFFDPPYGKDLIPPALIAFRDKGWIAPGAVIVAETAKKENLIWPEGFAPVLDRAYGDTRLWFTLSA